MIELDSMALAMPHVEGHPNRRAFRGVLTTVDVPSNRAPSGAKGHLVVLTRQAAEAALPSLLGMALDYAPMFDRHDVRRKVGVITHAEIVGRSLELGGYLFARDFPEIVAEIEKSGCQLHSTSVACSRESRVPNRGTTSRIRTLRATTEGMGVRASLQTAATHIRGLARVLQQKPAKTSRPGNQRQPMLRAESGLASGESGLGLSYEVTDVQLADIRARIWLLEKVTFTGAAILRRDKAAYQDTWIGLTV
jgi:hypothetical protein